MSVRDLDQYCQEIETAKGMVTATFNKRDEKGYYHYNNLAVNMPGGTVLYQFYFKSALIIHGHATIDLTFC